MSRYIDADALVLDTSFSEMNESLIIELLKTLLISFIASEENRVGLITDEQYRDCLVNAANIFMKEGKNDETD